MIDQMLAGRIVLLILSFIIAGYIAFKQTPELDEVENAFMYRMCYGLLIVRIFAYTFIDAFGLFPLE